MSGPESQPNEEIILRTPEGLVASINMQGAFVESLTAPDGQELLFPRQELAGKDRGGIPICAPVFGPGNTVNLPQHGFARNLVWAEVAREDSSTVRLLLADPGNQDQASESVSNNEYAHLNTHLEIKAISEGDRHSISMVMVLDNAGDREVIVTPGFHPYFPIGSIQETGLNLLSDDGIESFNPELLAEAVTLPSSELGEIGFSNGTHNISIKTSNLNVPVIWTANPDQYICVEPTQAGAATTSINTNLEEPSVLDPGYSYLYAMQINWEALKL